MCGSFLWQPSGLLLIGSETGLLTCVDTTSAVPLADKSAIAPMLKEEWCCAMENISSLMCLAASSKIGNGRFFYAVRKNVKGVECFAVPDGMFSTANPVIQPVDIAGSGSKGSTCLVCAGSGGLLAAGGGAGSLAIFKIKDGSAVTVNELHVHAGPVLGMCFSADSSRIYSAGADGAVFQVAIVDGSCFDLVPSAADFDVLSTSKATVNLEDVGEAEVTWLAITQEKMKAKQEAESKAAKNQALKGIVDLSKRLDVMLKANASAADIDKMDRGEFVIDLSGKSRFLTDNSTVAETRRADIQKADMAKDMLASRIRQECWDSMDTHACDVLALLNAEARVSNFPVRKMPSGDQRKLDMVKRMRVIEIREIQRSTGTKETHWPGLTDEVPSTITWMVNAGLMRPSTNTDEIVAQYKNFVTEEEKKTEEAPVEEDAEEKEIPDVTETSPIPSFLYPPMAVRTDPQRKAQIVLLMELARQIAIDFNKQFDKLKSQKDDTLGVLEGKNERIMEILLELKSKDTCQRFATTDEEIVDSVLRLEKHELKTSEYESVAARETREKKEEEARIAAENNKGDDMPTRALKDMMNGTLEVKKEVVTTDDLVREEWMDEIPLSQMDAEQKKQMEDYTIAEKAIADATKKQRKAFELELKKLRIEVSEIVKLFDQKVDDMCALRSTVLEMILTQELYCLRLGLATLRREDTRSETEDTEEKLAGLNAQKEALMVQLNAFTDKKDAEEEVSITLNAELVSQEKDFRKKIQDVCSAPLDQNQVKTLNTLYKTKKSGKEQGSGTTSYSANRESGGQSSRGFSQSRQSTTARKKSMSSRRRSTSSRNRRSFGSTTDEDLGPLQAAMKEAQQMAAQGLWTSTKDPFLSADEARNKAQLYNEVVKSDFVPLTSDDMPDDLRGLSELVWDKLNELRESRSKKETEVATQSIKTREAMALMDLTKERLSTLDAGVDGLEKKLEMLSEREIVERKDLEVLTVFKQGQDEVEQGAVATDYSSSCLIASSIINSTNNVIKGLGDEKIKVLTKTKQFRKKINYMTWEHEYLEQTAADMDEHYTDLQLLRVNSKLKQVISGTKTDSERVKNERSEARIEKIEETHGSKMSKLEKANKKIMSQIKERLSENDKLDEQLVVLESNVSIRENIYKSRQESGGGQDADPSARKMKRIMMRRKLIDLAKAQTDEIEFLRMELDRLRQKTFPSFANAARERLSQQPDELDY